MNIIYVSSFPPQRCGIASYTWSLARSIAQLHPSCKPSIISFKTVEPDLMRHVDDGIEVYRLLRKGVRASYLSSSQLINRLKVDVVHLQHEFGLFGGRHGSAILPFIENIKRPLLVTFHSVKRASAGIKRIVARISEKAGKIIVHSRYAASALHTRFKVPEEKIRVVPHGVPFIDLMKIDRVRLRRRLGLEDRLVIANFGLMSPRKGLEYAIKAMKLVAKEIPQALFLILGATHPNIIRKERERYRESLQELTSSLKLDANVRLVNKFMDEDELLGYLIASDIYLIPYPNRNQVSSGTLSYALSCGKAVISTPFHYAVELLGSVKERLNGGISICQRGIIVPPKNPVSISKAVILLAEDAKLRSSLESESYSYALKNMMWPNVAGMHLQLYGSMLKDYEDSSGLDLQVSLRQGI
ncbi:MAG: glycosyltransferase [Candidatus Bathyarchaeia archaeon]